MAQLAALWKQAMALFENLFLRPDWRNILDVTIIAILIYQGIKLATRTRASALFKGIAAIVIVAWTAELMQLNVLSNIMQQLVGSGLLVIMILFQPELRKLLEQLGRSRIRGKGIFGGLQPEEENKRETEELVTALTNLSRRRIGALIVLERETGLKDIMATGTRLDAEISAPLIENVFEPNTPLHDGAMIIQGERISAAACILPLTENSGVSRELGTRHRAALGISEATDAIVLIVSEETGIISTAREGKLTRHLDAKGLRSILDGVFTEGNSAPLLMNLFKRKEEANE
ncbi:MAG: TIGR00159 family protein [Clostridiales bacterium]|nr:TIGR00159 family protein [Clostridiales bacterium]